MDTPRSILLIDNDPDFVETLRARLEAEGYRCVTACSGAQGLARFEDDPPDLVISDLNMPAGDGIDLVKQIRKRSKAPVIIVTGFRDEYRRDLRKIRNVTILRKPFQKDALLSLVEAELTLSLDGDQHTGAAA